MQRRAPVVVGDTLTIKGERPAPLGNVDYVMQERPFGKFQRTLDSYLSER